MQYDIIKSKNNLRLVEYENDDGIKCRSWLTATAMGNDADPSEGVPASIDFFNFVNLDHPSPIYFDRVLK